MRIRTVIVGTGNAARCHLDAVRASGAGLEIVGIAGRDPMKTEAFAASAGVVALSPAQTFAAASCDAVILAVPALAQPALAVAAFKHGKHVLCEKPLAPSSETALEIASAWRSAGTVGMVNFCFRLVPAIAEFRRQLDEGICGELNWIEVQWVLASRLDSSLPFNWKSDASAGGGALRNFGSHVIDYLFHGKDVHVRSAWQRTLTPTRRDADGGERKATADEALTALFDVAGWCPVIVHISLITQPQIGHRLVARGSAGTLEAWNTSPTSPAGPFRCTFSSDGTEKLGSEQEPASQPTDLATLFRPIVARFADTIHGRGQASPSIGDGVRVVAIADAVAAAAFIS